ncbi:hypothetical protein BFI36_16945 [Yersinia pestis subsp. microtus bv. Caucasica]|uniref:hypothetical protein n=1 Tax=Yersinia pestis TaxID=632 RepID=UPI0009770CB5|nr:hypothetical protein [Yersinia pestis]OMK84479.1 hypothetical protein BFI36_16945 [Yersinia pestis subsp. microtus bv. Caucasica]
MATINERLRDEVIAHSLFQSRYGAGVARKMVKVLNESDAELSARLIVAPDELNPNRVTVKRLESLLASVRQVNKQAVDAMYTSLSDELLDFAKHEVSYQLSLFDSLLPGPVLNHFPLASITKEQVYAAAMAQPFQGRLLRDWAENIEADRMTRIINTVKNGYLAGDTVEQMARKVRGTRARNYQDGAIEAGRKNVTAVVKTAVTHMAAVARDKFADNNSNIIDAKQWLSTLDNKTSHDCIIRDRLKYTLEGKPIGHKIPYLQGPGRIHFCCRSMETLITKSWRELGIDIDEMDEGTRASMDGQVPAGTTYSEWLQRQSYRRQVQVLGETRARLMQDGGMRTDEFFTDKGEWITLQQLRDIDGRAFSDAGL